MRGGSEGRPGRPASGRRFESDPAAPDFVFEASIPGPPVGKGRPRASTRGGFVRLYTPPKTAQWEGLAAVVLRGLWGGQPPVEDPVSVGILALFPRPQRMLWKRKPMPREPYVQKPDLDNVVKAVLDSVEKAGILKDDKQVWSIDCLALYCAGDENPRVEVRVGW